MELILAKVRNIKLDWERIKGDIEGEIIFIKDSFKIPNNLKSSEFKFSFYSRLTFIIYDIGIISLDERNKILDKLLLDPPSKRSENFLRNNKSSIVVKNSAWKKSDNMVSTMLPTKGNHQDNIVISEWNKSEEWHSAKMRAWYLGALNKERVHYAFVFQYYDDKLFVHNFGWKHK